MGPGVPARRLGADLRARHRRIVSVRDGRATEVARIPESRLRGEGGLLGIALAPTGHGPWLYAYYTTAGGQPDRAAAAGIERRRQRCWSTGIPAAAIHNGGRLAFGPDGFLYAGTGDADRKSARRRTATSLGGKILRMTTRGQAGARQPVRHAGVELRATATCRASRGRRTGRCTRRSSGRTAYDELNRIEPGRNYGWPEVEGDSDDSRFVRPLATWTTADASPSGVAVFGDRVYVACLRGRKVYRVSRDGSTAERLLDGEYGRLRTVARRAGRLPLGDHVQHRRPHGPAQATTESSACARTIAPIACRVMRGCASGVLRRSSGGVARAVVDRRGAPAPAAAPLAPVRRRQPGRTPGTCGVCAGSASPARPVMRRPGRPASGGRRRGAIRGPVEPVGSGAAARSPARSRRTGPPERAAGAATGGQAGSAEPARTGARPATSGRRSRRRTRRRGRSRGRRR